MPGRFAGVLFPPVPSNPESDDAENSRYVGWWICQSSIKLPSVLPPAPLIDRKPIFTICVGPVYVYAPEYRTHPPPARTGVPIVPDPVGVSLSPLFVVPTR